MSSQSGLARSQPWLFKASQLKRGLQVVSGSETTTITRTASCKIFGSGGLDADDQTAVLYDLESNDTVGSLNLVNGQDPDPVIEIRWSKRPVPSKVLLLPWSAAYELEQVARFFRDCHEPELISEEAFDYAMNVLPPQRWTQAGDALTFRVSELQFASMRWHYAAVGDLYLRALRDSRSSDEWFAEAVAFARETKKRGEANDPGQK